MEKGELRDFLLASLALGLLQKPLKLKKTEELYISYNIIYMRRHFSGTFGPFFGGFLALFKPG
jgi:hypothetical protein